MNFLSTIFLVALALLALFTSTSAQTTTRVVMEVLWKSSVSVDYDVYIEQIPYATTDPTKITDKALRSLILAPTVLLDHPLFTSFFPNPAAVWGHLVSLDTYAHYIQFDLPAGKTYAEIYNQVSTVADDKTAYEILNDILVNKDNNFNKVSKITFVSTEKLSTCFDATTSQPTCGANCFPCQPGTTCSSNSDCAFKCVDDVCTQFSSAMTITSMTNMFMIITLSMFMAFTTMVLM